PPELSYCTVTVAEMILIEGTGFTPYWPRLSPCALIIRSSVAKLAAPVAVPNTVYCGGRVGQSWTTMKNWLPSVESDPEFAIARVPRGNFSPLGGASPLYS